MHQISIFFLVVLGGVTIAIFIFIIEKLSRNYCMQKEEKRKRRVAQDKPSGAEI